MKQLGKQLTPQEPLKNHCFVRSKSKEVWVVARSSPLTDASLQNLA